MPAPRQDPTLPNTPGPTAPPPPGSFTERAYALCSRIPRGRVVTYAEMARALGSPGAVRAVGNAMRRNPDAPAVPCHRVVGSDRRLTGYAFGLEKKAKLLRSEGVRIVDGKVDPACFHHFVAGR